MNTHNNNGNHFGFENPAPAPHPSNPLPAPPMSNHMRSNSLALPIFDAPQGVSLPETYQLLSDLGTNFNAPKEFHGPEVSEFLRGDSKNLRMPQRVEDLEEEAQRRYKDNVEIRKRQQLANHRRSTGRWEPTPAEMRKYTNRATAGAGKTKAQNLLKELTRFGKTQTEYSQKLISFLLRKLQEAAQKTKSLEAQLAATSPAPPVNNEPTNSQPQANLTEAMQLPRDFEQQAFLSGSPGTGRNGDGGHGSNFEQSFEVHGNEQPTVVDGKFVFEGSLPEVVFAFNGDNNEVGNNEAAYAA